VVGRQRAAMLTSFLAKAMVNHRTACKRQAQEGLSASPDPAAVDEVLALGQEESNVQFCRSKLSFALASHSAAPQWSFGQCRYGKCPIAADDDGSARDLIESDCSAGESDDEECIVGISSLDGALLSISSLASRRKATRVLQSHRTKHKWQKCFILFFLYICLCYFHLSSPANTAGENIVRACGS